MIKTLHQAYTQLPYPGVKQEGLSKFQTPCGWGGMASSLGLELVCSGTVVHQ
jgi:hypothetical protein